MFQNEIQRKMAVKKRIRDLEGLGPKSEEMIASVGISSVDAFMDIDPFVLYAKLKENIDGIGLNFIYAIIGAREGLNWQTVAKNRKTGILMKLDDMGLAPK